MKIKKAFFWIAFNAATLSILYLWLFNGVLWAENLTKFLIVSNFVTGVIIGPSSEGRRKMQETGRSVPKGLNNAVNLTWIALLASQGHFVLAAIFTISSAIENAVFEGWIKD